MNKDAYQNIRTSRDAIATGLPVFKIISDGALKAYKLCCKCNVICERSMIEQKGQTVAVWACPECKSHNEADSIRRFSAVASGNNTDLVGDVMTKSALTRMKTTFVGKTIFLNHQYQVPEDVLGSIVNTDLVTRKMADPLDGAEKEFLCLVMEGDVEPSNERAVKTHDMMMNGIVKLGTSVSVLIVDKSLAKDGRRLINDVFSLEWTVCGLPMNPISWVESASKALKLFADDDESADTTYTKPCVKCNKSVDTMHDFTQTPCPHCEWQASKADIAALIQADTQTDKSTPGANNPEALPVTEIISKETIMETETHTAEEPKSKITRKGLFNDELQRQESSIWHLLDILSNALYDLYYEAVYYNTDIDASAELNTICTEFQAALNDRFLPRLQSEDKSLFGADLAKAKLEKAAAVFAFLGSPAELQQKMQIAIKEGRRNSATDQKMVEEIHGLTVELGAACKAAEPAEEPKETAAPEADKTASQASGEQSSTDESPAELETLKKSVAELEETVELATSAAELANKARKEALEIADLSVKALEKFAKQPMPRPAA